MNRNHHHEDDFNPDSRGGRGRRGPRGGGPEGRDRSPFDAPGFEPDASRSRGPRPEGRGRGFRGVPDVDERPFGGPGGFGGRGGRPDGPFGPPQERFGPQDGPRGRGGRRGHGPRGGRAGRGDVRVTILRLLSEEPMHGYQLMRTIAERSGGRWSPSAGAVYPTLSALADEGLITLAETDGRKLATLTEAGVAHVAEHSPHWADPFADAEASGGPDIPALMHELHAAVRHAAHAASAEQRTRIGAILTQARSDIYTALAASEDDTPAS